MFTDVVGRDSYRPMLMGVHFEEDCCIATDTHMLVVYNQGNANLSGKTITVDGQECKGKYPDWKRVIPSEMPYEALPINLAQLHKALKWHKQQLDSNKDDKVAFDNNVLSIDYLTKILNIYAVAEEISVCQFYINEQGRPAKFISPSLTAILMPATGDNVEIDAERQPDCALVLSYETIINNYAFNNWKKAAKQEELAWIS